MPKHTKFRPNFSGNVNAKDGSIYTIPSGGELVVPVTGTPIELADGEYERLDALGAFVEPPPDEALLRVVGTVVNVPTAQLAHGTAPEGEAVTTPGIDVPDEAPTTDEDKPARARRS